MGLVSSYRDSYLTVSAALSALQGCDTVLIGEGGIGDPLDTGEAAELRQSFQREPKIVVLGFSAASDAAKRSYLLRCAQDMGAEWGLVLDSDELLVWGSELRVQVAYMEALERATGEVQMGSSLRLVELDGSVVAATGRLLRLKYVECYLTSVYHLLLTNGVEVAKPNIPLVRAGEPDALPPVGADARALGLLRRRPLQGEPHILHRSALRDPGRVAERQHQAEARDWRELEAPLGVGGERPAGGGVPIWLPEEVSKDLTEH